MGALANLGHRISDQTVGNILRRYKIAPAPERTRKTTWKEFIRSHMDVLAGTDFFTVEVLTWRGFVTYYVLFFIAVGSRRVTLAGITRHPDSCWMEQVARNLLDAADGFLAGKRYLILDRDPLYTQEFRAAMKAGWGGGSEIAAEQPEPERVRRAVRAVDQERMSRPNRSVGRKPLAAIRF